MSFIHSLLLSYTQNFLLIFHLCNACVCVFVWFSMSVVFIWGRFVVCFVPNFSLVLCVCVIWRSVWQRRRCIDDTKNERKKLDGMQTRKHNFSKISKKYKTETRYLFVNKIGNSKCFACICRLTGTSRESKTKVVIKRWFILLPNQLMRDSLHLGFLLFASI